MIPYFKKINVDLSDLDLESANSGIVLHNPQGMNFFYYSIKEDWIEILKNRLPLEYREKLDKICYCKIIGPCTVPPHRDKKTVNAINYYFKVGPSATSFYEFTNSDPKNLILLGKKMEESFTYDSLIIADSFSANPHDCYILNTKAVHDVKIFTNEERHFINFIFQEQL